jgi:uncharacterized protein (DUF1501 family)
MAYGRGGALETVIGPTPEDILSADAATGVFFAEQTPESMAQAIRRFEAAEARFDPHFIQLCAQRFDLERFQSGMRAFINRCLADFQQPAAPTGSNEAREIPDMTSAMQERV